MVVSTTLNSAWQMIQLELYFLPSWRSTPLHFLDRPLPAPKRIPPGKEARMRQRGLDYLLILAVGLTLFFPRLGSFALWEEDEAHNAGCAREMLEADTWVVPTFNHVLRTDKPPLQYWCILVSYKLFGISEWSARLPSALASMLTLVVVYELGRQCFNRRTGLLSSIVLGSSLYFSVVAHAVTPDAFLILTTLLTFTLFACQYESQGTSWLVLIGITTGLAVLAKGPVGLVLPVSIVGMFLIWERQWHRLQHRHVLFGCLLFAVVAAPWYIAVGIETRWAFWRGFFLRHNVDRFMSPMEGHRGGWWFHPLVLLAAMSPWTIFLGPVSWFAWKGEATKEAMDKSWWRRWLRPSVGSQWKYRFLFCWILVWMSVFSIAATKLPNYIVPLYPALAVLIARFLERCMAGEIHLPVWIWRTVLGLFGLVGIACSAGMLIASAELDLPFMRGRVIPSLSILACLGLIPILGALLGYRYWHAGRVDRMAWTLSLSSVLWLASMAAFGVGVVDQARAPRALALAINQVEETGDYLVGCHARYHPSLVFYTGRTLQRSLNDQEAIDLLHCPWPAFLVIGGKDWPRIEPRIQVPTNVLSRRFDFQSGQELLLIWNRSLPSSSGTNHMNEPFAACMMTP